MKYILFFLSLYLFAQTCSGVGRDKINQLHIVFISNMVDPNENEMRTLTNLVAYPFSKASNTSLITYFGLVVNYTVIFSTQPDDTITLRGLDMDRYSIEYFDYLVQKHAPNSCKGASLKLLQKALEITSSPSIIFMAANKRPKGTTLMVELLETMVSKMNPVIVLQIAEDGSISNIPIDALDVNINYHIPAYFKRNDRALIPEYGVITNVAKDILQVYIYEALVKKLNALRHPHILLTLPKINNIFPTSSGKRSTVFVYDIVNATEKELDEVSLAMEKFYNLNLTSYTVSNSHFMLFSSQLDTITTFKKSVNYTVHDFRTMLYNQTKNSTEKSTLKSLRDALQFARPFSLIVYFVKDVPDDHHEILPEVVQLIMDKCILVKIVGYGVLSAKNKLPILYRTIVDTTTLASGAFKIAESHAIRTIFMIFAILQGKKFLTQV